MRKLIKERMTNKVVNFVGLNKVVPVIKGKKSELEKFAGGLYTTSVEVYV